MQSSYPHPIIAREGWPFLAVAVAISILVSWFSIWWSLPLWLATLFVLQFFRDPPRRVSADPGLVCAPADGRIVMVEKTQDPFARRPALKISVFMNVFNVHSNRAPVDGEVVGVNYYHGTFLNAALGKASLENERNVLQIRMNDGGELTCVQIAGLVARRILCYVSPGDRLLKGERFGFIRFGSRVDLYLTPQARACVTVGDKVYAGETVLAELETGSSGK
ncbi:MAG: phosphatidylserine decarboxylase [Betaproteobacteria bacterium]|nr:MAG: phosphatidylserine decarboxylase [Betaproteobacteria bacterium]